MPIRSLNSQIQGAGGVLCRPACCKTPSLVTVVDSVSGDVNPASIFVQYSSGVVGFNSTTFTLERTGGSGALGPIRGGVSFDTATRKAVFTPAVAILDIAGIYTGSISGVSDVAGCKLADFSFTFTVT